MLLMSRLITIHALFAGVIAAQQTVTVTVVEGANGNLQPVNIQPSTTTTVEHCLSVPIPAVLPTRLLRFFSSFVSLEVNYNAPNFRSVIKPKVMSTPTDALLILCGFSPVCPVPVIDSCGPSVLQQYDYGSLRADLSVYSAAAGGGFSGGANYTKIAEGSWTMNETFEINSPVVQSIELPIHIAGDVLASESFGDPAQTWGKAKLEITGSAIGQPVQRSIAVESTSVLPDTAQIQVTDFVPLTVPAGVSTHNLTLTSVASVEAKATSAGLFGTLTGAATAVVNAPNSIVIGRFRTAGGGSLAAGTTIRGLRSGAVYEGLNVAPAPFRLVPGCVANGEVLLPAAPGAPVPGSMSLTGISSGVTSGFSVLFAGLEGTNSQGCGLQLLRGEEVLVHLAYPPIELLSVSITGGQASYSVPIPNAPAIRGVTLLLQSVNGTPGGAFELSTGVSVVLG